MCTLKIINITNCLFFFYVLLVYKIKYVKHCTYFLQKTFTNLIFVASSWKWPSSIYVWDRKENRIDICPGISNRKLVGKEKSPLIYFTEKKCNKYIYLLKWGIRLFLLRNKLFPLSAGKRRVLKWSLQWRLSRFISFYINICWTSCNFSQHHH